MDLEDGAKYRRYFDMRFKREAKDDPFKAGGGLGSGRANDEKVTG